MKVVNITEVISTRMVMDPEYEAIVLFTSTIKGVQTKWMSIDRRIPPNTTSGYEPSTVQILKLDSARYDQLMRSAE